MRSSQTLVSVGTTSLQAIAYNSRRLGIIFSGDGINTFTISQNSPVVVNAGYVVGTGPTGIELNYWDLGDNIKNPFFAICSVSTGKLTVTESFL